MRMLKFVLILSIVLISAIGCEADRNNIDYREPYVGSFTFSSYAFSYLYWLDTTRYHDTIVFQGSIELDNEKDSVIIIKYRPPDSSYHLCGNVKVYKSELEPFLGVNGSLSFPDIPPSCVIVSGQFYSTDSLHFSVNTESAGGRWGHVVSGARK